MPMAMPPVYLDVPAVIRVVAHSPAITSSIGRTLPHLGAPVARPLGFSSVPNIVAQPRAPAAPQGLTQGPDIAPTSRGR